MISIAGLAAFLDKVTLVDESAVVTFFAITGVVELTIVYASLAGLGHSYLLVIYPYFKLFLSICDVTPLVVASLLRSFLRGFS